ncbi:hypothetical protein HBH44_241780 [Parastagonospora nodorum]|nr:hypothetical protein HBH45_141520 [Parastagonospora nodorum]KAH4146429.1 hypothetical protein HBH44_241780 [Parastagonospora nodorum]KAH4611774.1 hypothetical protein HBH55_240600 [Parastagonospora nodorum]KAH4618200.1 hypothetical protein HBH81_243990 [Parastagonospora nodorum]
MSAVHFPRRPDNIIHQRQPRRPPNRAIRHRDPEISRQQIIQDESARADPGQREQQLRVPFMRLFADRVAQHVTRDVVRNQELQVEGRAEQPAVHEQHECAERIVAPRESHNVVGDFPIRRVYHGCEQGHAEVGVSFEGGEEGVGDGGL